jgi:hypothetical protein
MPETGRLHGQSAVWAAAERDMTSNRVPEGSALMRDPEPPDPRDFCLVSGGPLYQLWGRTRLSDPELRLVHRRALAASTLAWLPLLLLSWFDGRAWGSGVAMTFLQDVEVHARMLVAVPLFMLAEVWAHRELPPIVRRFVLDGLVTPVERPRFDAAIDSATRWRNSVVAELLLVAIVYGLGIAVFWRTQFALDVNTWYASTDSGRLRSTLAGWWMVLVSMPIFLFFFLRWCYRLLIWTRFLWQVSRLDLDLEAAHPDGMAGLHFVTVTEHAYRPILLAMGSVLSGMIANRILYTGAALIEFKLEIVGTVILLLFAVLGPLLVFIPNLRSTRRRGIAEYGTLGQRYARQFRQKWASDGPAAAEPLLGSADIQSLADLHNAYQVVEQIPILPFHLRTLLLPTLTVLLPLAPLLLTTFSVEELVDRLASMLF